MQRMFDYAYIVRNADGTHTVRIDTRNGNFDDIMTGTFAECATHMAHDIRQNSTPNIRVEHFPEYFAVYDDDSWDYNEPLFFAQP